MSAPTISTGCACPMRRMAFIDGTPARFSRMNSFANCPFWISLRIFFISAFVWSETTRGPRV